MASIVLATSPAARASPCDDYKAVLAERFEAAGVRGYSLQLVPADDPVPPGAKVIATCESGARKFLYRRWATASAAPSPSPSQAPVGLEAPVRQAASTARAAPATAPSPSSAPAPGQAREANAATLAAPAPASSPIAPAAASANLTAAPRPVGPAVNVAPPATENHRAAAEQVTLVQRAVTFAAGHWQWIGALAVGALVAGLWLWRSRFSAYDRSGLPRGPRL